MAAALAALVLLGALIPPANATVRWVHTEPGNWVYGYLTLNGGVRGISWTKGVPSEDNDGPVSGLVPDQTYKADYDQHHRLIAAGQRIIPRAELEFTSDPLPRTLHINANYHIQVELFLKGYPDRHNWRYGTGCGLGPDPQIAVELYNDGAFIGGHWMADSRNSGAAWYREASWSGTGPKDPSGYESCFLMVAPEVATLEKGSKVSLKMIHLRQSKAFQWGLQGEHTSRVAFPIFRENEWVFRDPAAAPDGLSRGGVLVKHDPHDWVPVGAFAAVLLIPVTRRAHGNGRPLGARACAGIAILLAAALSGCVATPENIGAQPDSEEGGTVQQTLIPRGDNTTTNAGGTGSVVGVVHDSMGVVLPRVHVIVLHTAVFSDTDADGRFYLNGAPLGSLVVRFEKKEYRVLEVETNAQPGFVTRLDVTLIGLNEPTDPDLRAHRHDYWGTLPRRVVMDETLLPTASCTYSVPVGNAVMGYSCPSYLTGPAFQLPPPKQIGDFNSVLPGTYHVDVTVTWTPSDSSYSRVGLMFRPNGDPDPNNWTDLYPRANPAKFRLPSTWEMDDPAHVPSSSWEFLLYTVAEDCNAGALCLASARLAPAYHVVVEIEKGVVPLEPGHPDLWNGTTSIKTVDLQGKVYMGRANNDYGAHQAVYSCTLDPITNGRNRYCATFHSGAQQNLTPMETATLDVYLNQSRPNDPAFDWILSYRPANSRFPVSDTTRYAQAPPPLARLPESTHWRIQLQPGEADPAYAKKSGWAWYLTPDDTDATAKNVVSLTNGHLDLHFVVIANRGT